MPERTLAAFLAGLHRLEQFPELAKMRGLHNQGFWEDLMHDDLLGILLDLSGLCCLSCVPKKLSDQHQLKEDGKKS